MSDALRIFTHAITMVFRDFGATLRATYAGVALIALSIVLLIFAAPDAFNQMVMQNVDEITDISNIGLIGLAFLLMAIGYLMMVAAWHRFVLLPSDRRDEGFTPGAGIVLGYLGRSILLGLCMMVLAFPVFIPVGVIAAATGSPLIAGIATIPVLAFLIWVFLRLSLILPACTIGRNMRFKESWTATKPYAATIFALTILMALADFIINLANGALPPLSIIAGLISVVVSVLYALVSASILTTLYGIAIEGRQI